MSPYVVASWLNHLVCLHARAARCARMSLNDTPPSTKIVQVPQEFGVSLRQVKQDQPIDLSVTAQSANKGCAFSFGLARSDFCHPDLMRMNVFTTVRRMASALEQLASIATSSFSTVHSVRSDRPGSSQNISTLRGTQGCQLPRIRALTNRWPLGVSEEPTARHVVRFQEHRNATGARRA
jgi:hypothetical protein